MGESGLAQILKKVILQSMRSFGYEIRRIKERKKFMIEPRQVGAERDSEGYEKVWSNSAFVDQYSLVHMEYYNNLIKFLDETKVMVDANSVADIGCGPGNLLSLLAKNWPGKELYGFDFSPSALKVAGTKACSAKLNTHDIYEPLTMRFDTVLCCETLEHLLYPSKALKNVLNATNLKCVLTVPDGRKDTYSGHINFWSEESWGTFLEEWEQEWMISIHSIGDRLCAILIRKEG